MNNTTDYQSGDGSRSANGSAAIEKAKLSLVGAACQYAVARDWTATWEDEPTRNIMAGMTVRQLARLADAALEYFRAVCDKPRNARVSDSAAETSTEGEK